MKYKYKMGDVVKVIDDIKTQPVVGYHEFNFGTVGKVMDVHSKHKSCFKVLDDSGKWWWVHEEDLMLVDNKIIKIPVEKIKEAYKEANKTQKYILLETFSTFPLDDQYEINEDGLQKLLEKTKPCGEWVDYVDSLLPHKQTYKVGDKFIVNLGELDEVILCSVDDDKINMISTKYGTRYGSKSIVVKDIWNVTGNELKELLKPDNHKFENFKLIKTT